MSHPLPLRLRIPSAPTRRMLMLACAGGLAGLALPVRAHHGWSSFDLNRPLWLAGRTRKVSWRNPHAEIELEIDADLRLPPDLAQRTLPAQVAMVDGPRLLGSAALPTRRDRIWQVELAPLTRMQAWAVPEIRSGESVAVLGYTFAQERGDALLRAEFLFHAGKVYGLRSAPA